MKIYKIASINYIHDFRTPQGAFAIVIEAGGKHYAYVVSSQDEINKIKKAFKPTEYTKFPGGRAINIAEKLASQAYEVTSGFPGQGSEIIREINLNEKLNGGKADNKSVEDIAKKHSISPDQIKKEIAVGLKIEMEHTNDKAKAQEIVLDHLTEFPDYYTNPEHGLIHNEKQMELNL